MNYSEYFKYAEMGSVKDIVYHNVHFKDYWLKEIDGEQYIIPYIDFDSLLLDEPTALSSKDLFFSLMELYNKICTLNDEDITIAILDWCKTNTHPYNIDALYELLVPADGSIGTFSQEAAELSKISVTQFKQDLIQLATHFNFAFSPEKIGTDSQIAMNLYKDYGTWAEYDYFEENREKAIKLARTAPENATGIFTKIMYHDYESFLPLLAKNFKPQTLQIKYDRNNRQLIHILSVNSVFDIAWFVFSKFITEDTKYNEFSDAHYFDDFEDEDDHNNSLSNITRCPICRDYISRSHNRKYCNKPACQAARKSKKASEWNKRNKIKKTTSN